MRHRDVNHFPARRVRCGFLDRWIVGIGLVSVVSATTSAAFSSADADVLFEAHAKAFYRVQDGRAWFRETSEGGKASFWMRAEQMEMVLDAYERTRDARQLGMFTNLFRGFITDHGRDWTANEFNDDILWMVIACTRAHLLSGNMEFREIARSNFDACFARAWSDDLGGGLWWKTDRQSKNACVNGPAAIAAMLLGRACQEPAYRIKATNCFAWERATLFDPSTGRVFDSIRRNGRKNRRCYSYNQGTFVGAANLLGYTNDAFRAATYTMNHLCRDGLLPAYGERGDGGGFNGICVRWIARFMNERNLQATFEPWLRQNAEAAWNVRRPADNLSWCRWSAPTPSGARYSWGCSSSVVILQVVRPTVEFPASLQQQSLTPDTAQDAVPLLDPDQSLERTCFQTGRPWDARWNLRSDVAIVYGIDEGLPERIESWRERGYRIHVMTGVSWGKYQDYLYGRFDGINHEDEAQTVSDGRKSSHGGDVYYMCPGTNFGRYLSVGVHRALDAGAEAIHLEEPEFWVNAGYSEAFKREWQSYYGEPWQAPNSSVDAQWRASKLKYFLYRRALQQVFDSVQDFNQRADKQVRCYVPTHSLLNYAHWEIVSPESSLARLSGCDGYIAQVWTGTSRTPNLYRGKRKERTFETAFLEYGAMQNLVRATGRRVWYLNDPIEDNPNHDWSDYQRNWESTMVASLFQPAVWRFEVAPWPERIFTGRYPRSARRVDRKPIPPRYATELQIVMNALNNMRQERVQWECGTTGLGLMISDSLMFERGDPVSSDPDMSHVYGLALPLLKRGMPVAPVQLENLTVRGSLEGVRVLLLTYQGMKPLTPDVHPPLVDWVRRGGVLVCWDDDSDPYNTVREWWNKDEPGYATPREHLFEQLGFQKGANERQEDVEPPTELEWRFGEGTVLWLRQNPAALAANAEGDAQVVAVVRRAAARAGLSWRETNYLLLRRGPYVIAAGLDESIGGEARALRGRFINLFNPELRVQQTIQLEPGSRFLLRDLDAPHGGEATLIASGCKVLLTEQDEGSLSCVVEGVARTPAVVLVRAPRRPHSIELDGRSIDNFEFSENYGLLWVRFDNEARARTLCVEF